MFLSWLFILISLFSFLDNAIESKVIILTSGRQNSDGFHRLACSAKENKLNVEALGTNSTTTESILESLRSNHDALALFLANPENTILAGNEQAIIERFKSINADIIFPNDQTEGSSGHLDKLLSSGRSFLGLASIVLDIFENENSNANQLGECPAVRVKTDSDCAIFQVVAGKFSDTDLSFEKMESAFKNTRSNSFPVVFLAKKDDSSSRINLNYMGNFIIQDQKCHEKFIKFEDLPEVPSLVVALFIREPTVFLPEFLESVENLDYSKSSIDLIIHNQVSMHKEEALKFEKNVKASYKSVTIYHTEEEYEVRELLTSKCLAEDCDYVLVLDSSARLDNQKTVKLLIESNRDVVAPILSHQGKRNTNFLWNFNQDQTDLKITEKSRSGLWNVACVTGAYLMKSRIFGHNSEVDQVFCRSLLDKNVFMFLSSMHDYGHLVDLSGFDSSRLHPELWHIDKNRYDYERRYIHENYSLYLQKSISVPQPCQDVFNIPMVTEMFADHLVEEMNHFGKWQFITGNPFKKIGVRDIDIKREMLTFLERFVSPLATRVFEGYSNRKPDAEFFSVIEYYFDQRFRPKPHFDASLYTVTIALNQADVDYTGGGARFIRERCSLTGMKKGWMVMHPGRLTHWHEVIPINSGKMIILVAFVDPKLLT